MKSLALLVVFLLLVACSPSQVSPTLLINPPTENPTSTELSGTGDPMKTFEPNLSNPYSPQAGDEQLMRANAYLDSSQINIMESYPIQIGLSLQGSLPTPCHLLRVDISQPDAKKRIQIDVYSIVDPDKICVQMLQAFDANISLGSFPTGHYSIWVNTEQVGEFDS
jgi:hypothetical protein